MALSVHHYRSDESPVNALGFLVAVMVLLSVVGLYFLYALPALRADNIATLSSSSLSHIERESVDH